jgi:hypothetical protein
MHCTLRRLTKPIDRVSRYIIMNVGERLILPAELLQGILPVLIGVPTSAEQRKVYYRLDDRDSPSEIPEVTSASINSRRATRSSSAVPPSTSTEAVGKKPDPHRPQKRPEIHIISSKSRVAAMPVSNSEPVDLSSSPEPVVKSRALKRCLEDNEEAEMEEMHGKHPLLCSLTPQTTQTAKRLRLSGRRVIRRR